MAKSKFSKIEKKWQKKWQKEKIFKADNKNKKKKFYALEMWPYPSGHGIHMGHARNYSIGDCLTRFKIMQGFNVLHPMGWDSFGLPAENDAISKGIHPIKNIEQNIKVMKKQMDALGIGYDWSRELATHDPKYYKWDQWLFLKLLENNLAYRKKAPGNWCPTCKTTLANEDVKAGRCWRCDTEVIQKEIEQWFVKITKYADNLLENINKLDWSNRLKALQKNWIGKSKGILVYFRVFGTGEKIPIFTTRSDTLFGCTFLVFAPEHPRVKELVKGTKYEEKVNNFLEKTKKLSELDRLSKEKDGLFIGQYAINPINGKKIPIYIANFVVMDYGTGAIMAVPAHDQRDFEFAKTVNARVRSGPQKTQKGFFREYNIPIKVVIKPHTIPLKSKDLVKAYTDDGILVNSKQFNGLENKKAIEKISDYLEKKKLGKRITNYKIRDWNVSRQRYWGAPIPIIYCKKCGTVPVSEKDLPVKLPLDVKFGKKGAVPLATNKKFVKAKCPKCGETGKRETDTMTTFVDSSWYFLRFCDPKNDKEIFDKEKTKYWMPINQYIGGIEHAVGHLLYARFITKFLKKLKYVSINEPFPKMLNQGIVNLGGVKMSKSKGNVVDPMDVINKHGADVLRTYLLFVAQPDTDFEWSDKDIYGIKKFIDKVLTFSKLKENKDKKKYIESIAQKKIKQITDYIEDLKLNKALIELVDFSNKIERYPSKYAIKVFLQMLTPFAPYICEEVWHKLGEKKLISVSKWPKVNKKKINEKAEQAIEALDNTISDIFHILKITDKELEKIYLYVIPKELKIYKNMKKQLSQEFGAKVRVFAVNDPKKHDPENKASKAKPGKPGIYIE
ncbi:leucine--tRNA ligase [Candidatus Woesearchaeota archaeon]|nr:leucine--tRNA ligase [Candidatus Woesearchaeota archaeon]